MQRRSAAPTTALHEDRQRNPALAGSVGAARAPTISMKSRFVDPLQVDRGDSEIRVAELPLDDVERHALTGHLDGVRVSELVRRESPSYTGPYGE